MPQYRAEPGIQDREASELRKQKKPAHQTGEHGFSHVAKKHKQSPARSELKRHIGGAGITGAELANIRFAFLACEKIRCEDGAAEISDKE